MILKFRYLLVVAVAFLAIGTYLTSSQTVDTPLGDSTVNTLNPWKVVSSYVLPRNASNGLQVPALVSCNTIDTDADGKFSCGTDEGGSGGAWSTSTADYWATTDLKLQELSDVQDPNAWGQLLMWTGSLWATTSTSSLGIAGTADGSFSTTSANYWETQQTARTADDLSDNDTGDLAEGTNLYWTSARGTTSFNSLFSAGTVGWDTSSADDIATATPWTAGQLAYVVDNRTLTSVATGTLTDDVTGLAFNATRGLIGGSAILSLTAGYEMLLTSSSSNWNTFYNTPSNRITDGNGLTWSGNTLNFDGGNTPAGDLGGTWASPSVTDDSHAHTSASISGIDISADTNLAVTYPVVRTDDTLSLAFGTTTANNWSLLQNFTTATATNLSVVTGIDLFGGARVTTANALCIQLTGSADLCDGSDATGSGGAGLATSTAIADTQIIYGTSPADVGAEAAFTYDDALDRLTVVNASTTYTTATTFFGNLTGLASLASALNANGSNCSAGSFPLGVNASGAVEDCTDAWTEAENTSAAYISRSGVSATYPISYNNGTGVFSWLGLSTSSAPVISGLPVWTSSTALGTVATGTLTENITGLEFSATGNLVGSSAILNLTSGYSMFLTASGTNWNTFYNTPSNRITDGDALTWSGNTLNFDGGNTPGGELGGTWASPTLDDSVAVSSWNLTTPTFTTSFTFDGVTVNNLSGIDQNILTGTVANTNAVLTVDANDDIVEQGLTWNVTAGTCSGDGNGGALTVNGSNQIVCSADDGSGGSATPAGSNGQIQFNNGGAFGADSELNWDNTTKYLGIGTSTPWAKLTIVSTSSGATSQGPAALWISTSTSQTVAPLLYVGATTTGNMDWARVGIGTSSLGTAGLRDQLTVSGRIYSTWRELRCDGFGLGRVSNITADTAEVCGSFAFDENGAGQLTAQSTVTPPGYGRISALTPAGSVANVRTWTAFTHSPENPVIEAKVKIPAGAPNGGYFVGFFARNGNVYLGATTSIGAFFEATSSRPNWWATVRNGTGVVSYDTGVATSSSFQKMRLELSSTSAIFLINDAVVREVTTNIPTASNVLAPVVAVSTASTATVNYDIQYIRVWIDDPPGGYGSPPSMGYQQPRGVESVVTNDSVVLKRNRKDTLLEIGEFFLTVLRFLL